MSFSVQVLRYAKWVQAISTSFKASSKLLYSNPYLHSLSGFITLLTMYPMNALLMAFSLAQVPHIIGWICVIPLGATCPVAWDRGWGEAEQALMLATYTANKGAEHAYSWPTVRQALSYHTQTWEGTSKAALLPLVLNNNTGILVKLLLEDFMW